MRLNLIEELYERMYEQRRELGTDERQWPHRIMGGRQIASVEAKSDEELVLRVQRIQDGNGPVEEEILEADLIIAATGYQRNAHVDMLKDTWSLLPQKPAQGAEFGKGISGWNVKTDQGERKLAVGRDYRVKFSPGSVAAESGVWLQGCCEGTHGASIKPPR